MGKTPDQLNLNDGSIRPAKAIDPRDTDWYKFGVEIDDLLATGDYTWAEDTLRDIQTTVTQRQCVTVGQRQAVDNIEKARRRNSRRHEGFHRW
jgi:hypothetical protein